MAPRSYGRGGGLAEDYRSHCRSREMESVGRESHRAVREWRGSGYEATGGGVSPSAFRVRTGETDLKNNITLFDFKQQKMF